MTDQSLLQDFIAETREHLEEMENNLLKLEVNPQNREILNDIFRSAHSTKSSAEYMGFEKIAEISHRLESLLEILRHGERIIDKEIIDTLIESRDKIEKLVHDLEWDGQESTQIGEIVDKINELYGGVENEDENEEITIELNGIDIDEVEKLYSSLKVRIYQMTGGDTNDKKKQEIEETLNRLLEIAKESGDEEFVGFIEKMKNQNESISYHDDAGDMMLAIQDIKKFIPALENVKINHKDEMTPESDIDELKDTMHEEESETEKYESIAEEKYLFDEFKEPKEDKIDSNILSEEDILIGPESEDTLDGIDTEGEKEQKKLEENMLSDEDDKKEIVSQTNIDKIKKEGITENNTYDEEYDEELLGIFIEHLDEALEGIRNISRHMLESGKISDGLSDCLKYISSLRSSANYMDYKELTDVYEEWMNEIKGATEQIIAEKDIDIETFIKKGIEEYVEKVIRFFPNHLDRLNKGSYITKHVTKTEIFDQDVSNEWAEIVEDVSDEKETIDKELGIRDIAKELDASLTPQEETTDQEFEIEIFEEEADDNHEAEVNAYETEIIDKKDKTDQKGEGKLDEERSEAVMDETKEEGVSALTTDTLSIEQDKKQQHVERQPEGLSDHRVKHTLRVDAKKIDTLMNQVGELVVNRAFFSQLLNEVRDLQQVMHTDPTIDTQYLKDMRTIGLRLGEATVGLQRVANDLQEGVMKVRMLPISQLFSRYPRLVRDLVQGTEKKINLEISGEETELDKMVIEEIADPLVHIIRNAVDHGCETVKDRRYIGKPETCTIQMNSYHESNHVVIEVEDDGKGIDPNLIKTKAIEKKMFEKDELDRMSEKELFGLIMEPGFSTAAKVTTTSGRGVGMDVVKKNIMKLNGTTEVDSKPGVGTCIRIKIPLTMAIIQALLVRVGSEIFTIPLSAVEEVIKIFEKDINIIEGVEVTHLRETTLTLIRLSELFNIRSQVIDPSAAHIVIVNTGMKQVGLIVDAMAGQEEAVIKPLIDYLQEDSGFSGATILGDGYISLILDVYELYNLSLNVQKIRRN